MDVTAFHLARIDLPEVRAMAELFPIDKIFDNPLTPASSQAPSSMQVSLHLLQRLMHRTFSITA